MTSPEYGPHGLGQYQLVTIENICFKIGILGSLQFVANLLGLNCYQYAALQQGWNFIALYSPGNVM